MQPCHQCGAQLPEGTSSCPYCGAFQSPAFEQQPLPNPYGQPPFGQDPFFPQTPQSPQESQAPQTQQPPQAPQMPQMPYYPGAEAFGSYPQMPAYPQPYPQPYYYPGGGYGGAPGYYPPSQPFAAPGCPPYYPQSPYPYQQYQADYYGRPQRSKQSRIIYSLSLGGAGLIILISVFLPWITFGGLASVSGWNTLVHPSAGNFIYEYGSGVLFFTGFWALLVGVAAIIGAIMFFANVGAGARIAQVAGVLGTILMLVNAIMLLTHHGTVGAGVWVFLALAVGLGIGGQLAAGSR